jgi:hypothetical protein
MNDDLSLRCDKCGSTGFAMGPNPQPDTVVRCRACGAARTYGGLEAAALFRRQCMGLSLREFMAEPGG